MNEHTHSGQVLALQEVLELGGNPRPPGLEVFPRVGRSFRKRFDASVSQLQPRLLSFREQFERTNESPRSPLYRQV